MWPAGARTRSTAGAGYTELPPLHRQRHTLSDADAHGGERALAAGLAELMRSRYRDARARHAERMAERDRAAVRIDVLGIVGEPELAHAGKGLGGERFVELDHIEAADLETQPRHQLLSRRHRADPH